MRQNIFLAAPVSRYFLALVIFLFVSLIFWSGVSGGFLFDDFHNIVTNANVQIKELTAASLWKAAQGYSDGTRQLAMISFALNAYWAGTTPWAFKVTGLLVHAFNAALVFFLLQRILFFSRTIGRSHQTYAALAVALVWALHPIQVSSALYVVQRMETLCFSFLLMVLLLYLDARRRQIEGKRTSPWLWFGIFLFFVLAALSKENAVILPLLTLSLEMTVLGFCAADSRLQRSLRRIYAYAFSLVFLLLIAWVFPHYYTEEAYQGRDFNTYERLLTQGRVLWLYMQQILVPLPQTLYFYYDDFPVSRSWLQPLSTLPAILAWLLVLGSAVCLRRRYPLAVLGLFWFLASHSITSNVIGLEMVFEHRNYFALLGVLLICAEIVNRLPARDGPGIKYAGVVVLVLGIGFLGAVRAAIWGTPLLLATDMAEKNPRSARAALDLGNVYFDISGGNSGSPFYQFAARQFERAAALPGASTQPDVNLILMHSSGGLPHDMLNIDAIWVRYLNRLNSLNLSAEARTSIWFLLEQRQKGGDINDTSLQRALEIITNRDKLRSHQYARVADYYLSEVGNLQKAEDFYEKSINLAIQEGYFDLKERIIEDLYASGHPEIAMRFMRLQSME